MSAGSVSGRMSSSRTWLGSRAPRLRSASPWIASQRRAVTSAATTAAAPSSQTRPRPPSASQRARSSQNGSGDTGSALPCFLKRQVRMVRTPPRSMSARTADAAASIAATSARWRTACGADADCARAGVAASAAARHTSVSDARATRPSTTSARERNAELLFDVPRFELDAAVQVHREAGADEERLDDEHRRREARDQVRDRPRVAAVDEQVEHRRPLLVAGDEPAREQERAERDERLDRRECALHRERGAAVRAEDERNPLAARLAALAFELQHGLNVRAPWRQAPDRQRVDEAFPPDGATVRADVGEARVLAERRTREDEQHRAVEPRLQTDQHEHRPAH